MINILAYLMLFIILCPFLIAFLIMIFKNDDYDSTHQSIDL